jgi:5,10-methylenetetrahydromethanopterin reductase
MMRFAFGQGFLPTELDDYKAVACAADEAGFAMVMTGDTPALKGDNYVGLTIAALETKRVRVGSYISNPVTRHPAVAAAGIASVNEISGGRAFLGLSTGDSGVYNLGLKPATQAQLEEYILTVRALLEQGEAHYQGRPVQLGWYHKRVPVYMAPGGPKGLRLAGRIADGVFLETGFIPEVIQDTLEQLASAAQEAGRSLDDIDIWWHARSCFGTSRDDAIDQIPTGLLGIGNRLARFQQEGKFIPDEIWPKLQQLKQHYDFMGHHETPGQPSRNAAMLDGLGLRDYLADRFGIVGTPEDFVTRIKQLESLGVKNIAFSGLMPDKLAFIATIKDKVMPSFR